MGKVIASITTSVDGYVTGPEYGLGRGGERLHYWVMGGPWTYEGGHDFVMHGPDKEFYDELTSTVASAVVGRGIYDAARAWPETSSAWSGGMTDGQPRPRTGQVRFTATADMEPLLAGAPGARAALLEEGGTASTRIHIRRDE